MKSFYPFVRLSLVFFMFLSAQRMSGQTTVTYTQQTGNYYTSFTSGTSGSYNSTSYQIGMYANSSGSKQSVLWRKFRTDASGSSTSDRSLQIGDQLVITLAACRAYGKIGFALLASPSTGSYANRESNYALSVNLDGPLYAGTNVWGNWYLKYSGGSTSAASFGGNNNVYKNFTFTLTLTAADRMNVSMTDGTTTSNFYDVLLNTANPITDYSVFLEDDYDGTGSKNIYWGLGAIGQQHTLTNTGVLNIGQSNTSFGESYVITNGLNANSASSNTLNNALTKSGTGTLTLSAANIYAGTTTVSGGVLLVNGSTSASSAASVASGTTLGGNGTAAGSVALSGTVAPGSALGTVGQLTAGAFTFNTSSQYNFDITNVAGTAGTNWDLLNSTGAVTISATAALPVTIALSGNPTGFNSCNSYTWTLASGTSISGFAANKFAITTTSFTPAFSGTFSIQQSGNNINLVYTAGTATWTGGTSTDWNAGSNWCGGVVPTAATSVVIPSGTTFSPNISTANANCLNLTINSGATLTMSNSYILTIAAGGIVTNNGTFTAGNGTVNFAGAGTLAGSSTTTFNNLTINTGALTLTTVPVIGGIFKINGGNVTASPIYSSGSTLYYNTSYNRYLEWNATGIGTIGVTPGYPYNVTINTGTFDVPNGSTGVIRALAGDLTISTGAVFYMNAMAAVVNVAGNIAISGTLTLSSAAGGDIKLGGNWTQNSGATFNPNGRGVFFTGSGTELYSASPSGGIFDYLISQKASGSIKLLSNLTVTGINGGNALSLKSTASFDLNGNSLILTNGTASNLQADGGVVNFIGIAGSNISFGGNVKTITAINSGTVVFGSNVVLYLTNGVNFGTLLSTINGTLSINFGGYVTGNAPYYAVNSLLDYNSTGSYGRGIEWGNASGPAYPYNVQVSNNTTFDPGGNGNTGQVLDLAGNLTIDAGSAMYLDYAGHNMTVPLIIAGNLLLNGSLSESQGSGGDISIAGNWTNNGNFYQNGRTVTFNGTSNQSITGSASTSFNSVTINNTNGVTVNKAGSVAGVLTLSSGLLTTTTANTISVTNNTSGAVTGTFSTTSYVNGPLNWTLTTGTSYLFPLGKGGNYYPFGISAITGTNPQIQAEAFNANSGGSADGVTLSSISTTEYWNASVLSGTYNTGTLSLGRAAIGIASAIGRNATTLAGVYTSLNGTVSGNSIINSDPTGSSLGYFVLAVGRNNYNISSSNSFTGGTTYCIGGSASPLSATFNTCSFGSGTGTATTVTVTWYSNVTNSTSGGTQVAQTTGASTGTASTVTFNYTPPTTTAGSLYYYAVLSAPSLSLACGFSGTLTSGTSGTPSTQLVIINSKSADPTSATSNAPSNSVCNGNTVTLTLNGGGGGTGDVIHWYTGSCGGTSVGTGNNLVVTPPSGATTTYYGRYEDGAPCNYNSACQSVAVTAVAQPTAPTTATGNPIAGVVCSGTTLTLSGAASGGTAGLSCAIEYQHSTDGGTTWIFDGTTIPSFPAVVGVNNNLIQARRNTCQAGCSGPTAWSGNLVTWSGITNTWTGAASTDWSNSLNWTCGVPNSPGASVMIPATSINQPMINSGATFSINSLTILGTILTPVTLTNNGTLNIAGTVSNTNGTIISTSGTIGFIGTSAQTIVANEFSTNTLKGLTISNAAGVTIGGSLTLTDLLSFGNVNNSTLNTGDFLILHSDTINTARIADITNNGTTTGVTINGKVDVERFISSDNNRAYRLLSPSVTTTSTIHANWQEGASSRYDNPKPGYGTHITGVGLCCDQAGGFDATQTGQSSLYLFTGTGWAGISNTNVNTLSATTGYLVFIRGDRTYNLDQPQPIPPTSNTSKHTVLEATGTVTQGTVNYTGATANNQQLIPNPYPSPLDWTKIAATNSTNFANYYIYWDPNVGTRGGYVTVTSAGVTSIDSTGLSGPARGTTQIQSGIAFFVTTKAGVSGTPTFVINEPHKGTTNNIDVFTPLALPTQLYTSLFYNDYEHGALRIADGVLAQYGAYNAGVDENDAQNVSNMGEDIALARNGQYLSIETRPVITATDTLFLSITNMKTQPYEWHFAPQGFDPSLSAVLIDNYLGTQTPIDITVNTVISFICNTAIPASVAIDRFYIVFSPNGALPVTITSIKAYQHNTGVNVDWTVSQQINMGSYDVERSQDGRSFTHAGTVAATPSTGAAAYSWYDATPNTGANYYRVKVIDRSSATSYTNIVRVDIASAPPAITVYPNPVKGNTFTLQLTNVEKGNYTMMLINKLGQVIYTREINHAGGSGSETITLDRKVAQGTYELKIGGFTTELIKE